MIMKKKPLFNKYNRTQISGEIVKYCNRAIVPDTDDLEQSIQFPEYVIQWFERYFNFVDDKKTRDYLAEAYYQARFVYMIMKALSLKWEKGAVFIKVQVLQYASIYEALIEFTLQKYHATEVEALLKKKEYIQVSALSSNTKLAYIDEKGTSHELVTCRTKTVKKPFSEIRFSDRTALAVELSMITDSTKEKIDQIYSQRNSIHILKAVQNGFKTEIGQSKAAFEILNVFCNELRSHIKTIKQNRTPKNMQRMTLLPKIILKKPPS